MRYLWTTGRCTRDAATGKEEHWALQIIILVLLPISSRVLEAALEGCWGRTDYTQWVDLGVAGSTAVVVRMSHRSAL